MLNKYNKCCTTHALLKASMRCETISCAPNGFMLHLQNHDVTKPDAQQTFRLMHYFSVEGREFPEDFPRVMHILHDMRHIAYYPSQLLYCCSRLTCVASQLSAGKGNAVCCRLCKGFAIVLCGVTTSVLSPLQDT